MQVINTLISVIKSNYGVIFMQQYLKKHLEIA